MSLDRRHFLKAGALGAAGALLAGPAAWGRPLGRPGPLTFRPYPHPMMPELARGYVTDALGDPFPSSIEVSQEGITFGEGMGTTPFAVHTRWYVEGFGYVWLTADNGGRLYSAEDVREGGLKNLNVEFARTAVGENARVMARYAGEGTPFSSEVRHLHSLSQELLEEAGRLDGEAAGGRANQALLYGLWCGEKVELEHAAAALAAPRPGPFHFGCETRQFIWAKSEPMTQRFEELFNFATLTHYVWDSWYPLFEPTEGDYRWGIKDDIVDWLAGAGITIEGRPIVWFHPDVTPSWLAEKSFPEVMAYTERHARDLVGHYGDQVLHWEVVNEYHDWANVHNFTPEQISQVVRLACETTHDANPRVERIINNCCVFGEYAASGRRAGAASDRPLRTPRRFVQDLVEQEMPFETVGVQLYYPGRSLAAVVRHVERFAALGKPIAITEMGATSGPTLGDLQVERMPMPGPVYDWHRPWDEDLQADWLEQMYAVLYSKPYVHAINWYDFADFRTFIPNGGLVRENATAKPSHERLRSLLASWDRLPEPR